MKRPAWCRVRTTVRNMFILLGFLSQLSCASPLVCLIFHHPASSHLSRIILPPITPPSLHSGMGRDPVCQSFSQPLPRAVFHQCEHIEASETPRETASSCLFYRMLLGHSVMSWMGEDHCDGEDSCLSVDSVIGPKHR